ncbi:MAG: TetR family transcriptional regulator [Gemmatimonadales bacterium]
MPDAARDKILSSAIDLRLKSGHQDITVETVAEKAKCAKGLVAYHFKTKDRLFNEVDTSIGNRRLVEWKAALATKDAQAAIDACWTIIKKDSETRVAIHQAIKLTDWSGNNSFSSTIGRAALEVLNRAGRIPKVSDDEIASLCAVTLPGFALALAQGGDVKRLEGAYLAFWAALFALTRSA